MTLLFLACVDDDPVDVPEETGAEPVECDDSVAPTVESTAIATAPRVRFTTDASIVARVVFDNGDATERVSDPDEGGTEHDHVLIGILPEVSFAFRVEVLEGESYRCVGRGEGETGALPSGLPEWSFEAPGAERIAPGLNLLPVLMSTVPSQGWLLIVDEAGRGVWAWDPADSNALTATRAYLARDRKGLVYNATAIEEEGDAWFGTVGFDGEWERGPTAPGAHTDFVEIDGGRFAYIDWDIQEVEGRKFLGDRVGVVDAAGEVEILWNAFDHVELDLDGDWEKGFYVPDPDVEDWSHVNGISWDEQSDDLFVTMTAWDGVARIDGETGDQEWFLGTGWGDIDQGEGVQLSSLPHSVQWLGDDRMLVFNRAVPEVDACSWSGEIGIDAASGTATDLGRMSGDTCLLVSFFGLSERLPNGNTIVDWSSSGRLDELSPEGETLWSLAFDAGTGIGFTSRIGPLPE